MARTLPSLTAIGAGLAGGAVFFAVEVLFLPIEKHVPADTILRVMAEVLAGPVTLTRPAGQTGALLFLSLLVCGTAAVVFGFFFCRMEDGLSLGRSIVAAALMGFALYLVCFYLVTYLFPGFARIRGLTSLAACVLYGVTTAVTHKGLRLARLRAPASARRGA
jgi:hypothetical protein